MTSPDEVGDYFEAMRTLWPRTWRPPRTRGTLPGSQAGLANLFDYLQDTQPWFPAAFWFWNTRMMVAANMTSGAFELNTPVFHLYQSNIANVEAWTQSKMGGRTGICVPETMRFNGNGYWVGGESNASCDESASPSYNALTITSGAEVGLWVWENYLMTGDRAFLTTNYPLMAESAQFLLAYATQGSDGLLHTVANAHETQWNVQDPVTDIVAMQALFGAVISAATVLGTDAALVTQLQGALTKLPPLPRTDAATHMKLLTAADDDAGTDVIALSYAPSAAKENGENLDLEAVWPYGLIGDTGEFTTLAKRTYQARMFVHGADWSFDAIQAARLGLADEVVADLTAVTEADQTFINGTALLGGGTNDGSSEPYVEQLGVTAAAINGALVQDYDGLLRIGPAWPKAWDAAGTVFIHGSSKVDVQVKGGALVLAIVEAGVEWFDPGTQPVVERHDRPRWHGRHDGARGPDREHGHALDARRARVRSRPGRDDGASDSPRDGDPRDGAEDARAGAPGQLSGNERGRRAAGPPSVYASSTSSNAPFSDMSGVAVNRYPTPRTVSTHRAQAPSFSRSRFTWVSTVRVGMSPSICHTSRSSVARGCTRSRRSQSVTRRRNSRAVRSSGSSFTQPRWASRSIRSAPNRSIGAGERSAACLRRTACTRRRSSRMLNGLTM